MANYAYCARCGSKVDKQKQYGLWLGKWRRLFGSDLCPSCVAELREWIKPQRISSKEVGADADDS